MTLPTPPRFAPARQAPPQQDMPLAAVLPHTEGPSDVDACLVVRFHDEDLDVMHRAMDLFGTVRTAAPSLSSISVQEPISCWALDYPEAYRLLEDPWALSPESPWAPFAAANLDGAVGVADYDGMEALVGAEAWEIVVPALLHVRAHGPDDLPELTWEVWSKAGERWVFGSVDRPLLRLAALRRAPTAEHAQRLVSVLADRPELAARELRRTPFWRLAGWTPADLEPWLTHGNAVVRDAGLAIVHVVSPAVAPPPRSTGRLRRTR